MYWFLETNVTTEWSVVWMSDNSKSPDDAILDVDIGVEDAVLVDDASSFDEQSVLSALLAEEGRGRLVRMEMDR